MTQNSKHDFINVLTNKNFTPKAAPIWIMRQAGRYLPEFRQVRAEFDFFTVCQTPKLAAKVTLQPIDRYPGLLDAAIIDILVIPQAFGMVIEMQEKKGPVFINPLQSTDVPNILKTINVYDKLGYVFEAIKETKIQLNDRVPLIGFAGAPWTLLAYMIEGGGSKTLSKAKSWLYGSPDVCHELLNSITNVIVDYLIGQVNAGADCLQVFDSWGGELTPRMFQEFSLPYLEIIAKKVKLGLGDKAVPMIVFAKGAHASLNKLDKIGYDCVSLDWSIDVDQVDLQVAVQGNADPGLLYAPDEEIKKRVNEMMTSFKGKRHVVNLGHGMCPDHEPEKLKVFLEAVKSHQY